MPQFLNDDSPKMCTVKFEFNFVCAGSSSQQWYEIICSDRERKQRRVEELRKERQRKEMAECTFRPDLVTRSFKKVMKCTFATSHAK